MDQKDIEWLKRFPCPHEGGDMECEGGANYEECFDCVWEYLKGLILK